MLETSLLYKKLGQCWNQHWRMQIAMQIDGVILQELEEHCLGKWAPRGIMYVVYYSLTNLNSFCFPCLHSTLLAFEKYNNPYQTMMVY